MQITITSACRRKNEDNYVSIRSSLVRVEPEKLNIELALLAGITFTISVIMGFAI